MEPPHVEEMIWEKVQKALADIDSTLRELLKERGVGFEEARRLLEELGDAFNVLSQKWVLSILYALLFTGTAGFNELKRMLGASSRTLASKLKMLEERGFVERRVEPGPPLRTRYSLTQRGKGVALLSLPLLYYMARELRVEK